MHRFKLAISWACLSLHLGFVLGDGFLNKISLAFFLFSTKVPGLAKEKVKRFDILIDGKKNIVNLRRNGADAHLLSEILVDEWYKSYLPREAPRIIFDVGANIGLTTLYFKAKYPNAKIFCFEPDPDSYRILLENTRQLQDIRCFQVGLWDSEKTVKFFQSKHFNTRNSILLDEPEMKEIDVSVVPFDRALRMAGVNSVDFLKFDIEGAEVEMFKKMDYPTIRSFLGELHPGMRSEVVIEDLLASLGRAYDMKLTKGGKQIWHVYGKLQSVSPNSVSNLEL